MWKLDWVTVCHEAVVGDIFVQAPHQARYIHEQHLSCAQALKQYKSDHPERWDRVANAVEGKTQKQCKDRYRELRNNFRAKKS